MSDTPGDAMRGGQPVSLDTPEALRAYLDGLEVEHLRRMFADGPIRTDGTHWTATRPVTTGEVSRAVARAGRNNGPGMLRDLDAAGMVEPETVARLAPGAWSAAEWPERVIPRAVWSRWFRAAGLRDGDGQPVERPASLRLFRGASVGEGDGRPFGMSWTVDAERARWFAGRLSGRPGVVYTVTVPGAVLLADLRHGGRGEGEAVLDTLAPRFPAPVMLEALEGR